MAHAAHAAVVDGRPTPRIKIELLSETSIDVSRTAAESVETAGARLRAARRIVALTGAGISAESGVPTFRGPGGLWRQYRAEDLATPEAFAFAAMVLGAEKPMELADKTEAEVTPRAESKRANVVSPPRFISTEPSPSSTTTCSSGRLSAMPRPSDDARPMACWR